VGMSVARLERVYEVSKSAFSGVERFCTAFQAYLSCSTASTLALNSQDLSALWLKLSKRRWASKEVHQPKRTNDHSPSGSRLDWNRSGFPEEVSGTSVTSREICVKMTPKTDTTTCGLIPESGTFTGSGRCRPSDCQVSTVKVRTRRKRQERQRLEKQGKDGKMRAAGDCD
jgi:hypothetical protein